MGSFAHLPPHSCPTQCFQKVPSRCSGRPCLHRHQPARLHPTRSAGLVRDGQYRRSGQQLVRCMAHPRRVARVAKQIEREVGTLLLTDRVLQSAVCPEVRLGLDSAVSAIASVTEVDLSKDMQVAKIYISVYSDPHGKSVAMRGLSRLEGYVRKHIAATINMRLCPEIRFIQDDAIQRGEEVMALLERIRRQDAGEIEPPAIAIAGQAGSRRRLGDDDDDGDWDEGGEEEAAEDDKDDDDIIDDLDDDEGFLEGLLEEAGSRPRASSSGRALVAETGEEEGAEEDEEDEDDSDEEEDDDEDDEVDGESLRAWGINPDDPLALDYTPSVEGVLAPTVREPWRSARELKRVKGRATKKGRKSNSRGRRR